MTVIGTRIPSSTLMVRWLYYIFFGTAPLSGSVRLCTTRLCSSRSSDPTPPPQKKKKTAIALWSCCRCFLAFTLLPLHKNPTCPNCRHNCCGVCQLRDQPRDTVGGDYGDGEKAGGGGGDEVAEGVAVLVEGEMGMPRVGMARMWMLGIRVVAGVMSTRVPPMT